MGKHSISLQRCREGIERALERVRAAAATKNIIVMGGANIAQQYIKAGLLDEMRIHLVPVVLGAGTLLFDNLGTRAIELDCIEVINEPKVTHLRFRARRNPRRQPPERPNTD